VQGQPQPAELLGRVSPRRVSDLVADRIVAAIQTGALQPGDRLPTEHELARSLSVGRTSVREALQRLQTLGLIRVERGRGAFVSLPDQVEAHRTFARWSAEHRFAIEELLETRMSVEATAAALAAARAAKADVDELTTRNATLARASSEGELATVVGADEAFHDAVMRAGKNQLLHKVYSLLVDEIAEFRSKTLGLDGAPARAVEDHEAIIDAVRRGDVEGARTAMINHLWVLYEEVREAATSQESNGATWIQGATRDVFR
jgi:GntR family transcriptional repressor for pyruvate dehydrogenase complex